MGVFAALDVSQEKTAVCVVDDKGAILAEGKIVTCPDGIADWLGRWADRLEKIGMETGPPRSGFGTPLRRKGCRSSSSTRATRTPR